MNGYQPRWGKTMGNPNLAPAMVNTNAPIEPSMMEAMRQRIAAMPPGPQKEAALAAMLRNYSGEMDRQKDRETMAAELAATPMSKGTHLGGRYKTYVAASPLEHLATAMRQYGGMKAGKQAREKQEEIRKAEMEQAMREARLSMAPGVLQRPMPGRTSF
jgi:hypothetical protein